MLSLLLTEAAELLCALIFKVGRTDLPAVFLVNIMTNPPYVLAVLICRMYVHADLLPALQAFLEAGIILIEFLVYKKTLKICRHPFLLSVAANGFSVLCGILASPFLSTPSTLL